jgi:hypothetical protein
LALLDKKNTSKVELGKSVQPYSETGKKDVHATGAHTLIIPQQGDYARYLIILKVVNSNKTE